MAVKESQLILEKILEKSEFPGRKIKKALRTLEYFDCQEFCEGVDKMFAKRSSPCWSYIPESKNILDCFDDFKYKLRYKNMPEELKKEAKRLFPEYENYMGACCIKSADKSEEKMHERQETKEIIAQIKWNISKYLGKKLRFLCN